jgi:hypothetical protein
MVAPGLRHEFSGAPPEHLQPYWAWDFCSFHSPDWWRHHWEKTGQVVMEVADRIPEGWQHWLTWQEVQGDHAGAQREAAMLRADAGRHLGFTRLVARKKEGAP